MLFSSWLSDKPEWISKYDTNYSFVGISIPKDNKQIAIKDATINGLEQISNRLGVEVYNGISFSKYKIDNNISNKIRINSKLISFSKIENFNINRTYCEKNNNKFTCYVLISFTKKDFKKLENDTKNRIRKLNELLANFEMDINNLNYKKAKKVNEKLKLIPEANYNRKYKRFLKKFNSMINLEISDIKNDVFPLEKIEFSLISNKNGFLYVVYNNGFISKLIFPKKCQNNKIIKNRFFIFSSSSEKYDFSKNQKLTIIFSKEKINIPINNKFGIDKNNNLWKIELENKRNNLNAIVKIFDFKLKTISKNICIKAENNPISDVLKERTIKLFKYFGTNINCENYKYLIKIKVEKNKFYAEEEYKYIYEIKFTFLLDDVLLGNIEKISSKEYYDVIPDEEIAKNINQESLYEFNNDFKLKLLYKILFNKTPLHIDGDN